MSRVLRTARTPVPGHQRALAAVRAAWAESRLRLRTCPASRQVSTPPAIRHAAGFLLPGVGCVRSLVFSTDPVVIEHSNADAVLAVYPFTPSARVMRAICTFSGQPVFCGVGGGRTKGRKAIEMAVAAQEAGATAVVLNHPAGDDLIAAIRERVSIPIVSSIATADCDPCSRIEAGADILNVAAGRETARLLAALRLLLPDTPIIATGGRSTQTIKAVIANGADAVSFAPPSTAQLFAPVMARYRNRRLDTAPG